ncbi:MAG: hypothetical protein Fur0034_09310 [Desulfuromonadia bacterium]
MADCPFKSGCIFFTGRMSNMPAMAELMKTTYCSGTFDQCARYRVAIVCGRGTVPDDLYPMQGDTADSIIRERGEKGKS